MSFTPDEALITVDFTGTSLEGLDAKIRDVETDVLREMVRLSSEVEGRKSAGAIDQLICHVADMIVEWDLEIPAGTPLPPTREVIGQRSLGRFTLPLVRMCVNAVQDVGGDLKKDSRSGPPSLAVLPMTAP